jgi:RNA-directed DNA polymerase
LDERVFTSFGPQVSASSLKAMRQKVMELNLRKHTHVRLADIARKLNPLLQGWLNYAYPFDSHTH